MAPGRKHLIAGWHHIVWTVRPIDPLDLGVEGVVPGTLVCLHRRAIEVDIANHVVCRVWWATADDEHRQISRSRAEELRGAIVERWQEETPQGQAKAVEAMQASIREQDQRIKRLVGLYVSGEVSREHFQSLKGDYEEVKLSKLEALKALEEDAKDQRVVLDEALVILGNLPALWTSLDDNGKQAWVQVLFQKLVINDRGKVVDRVLNHPFDEILEFKRGRSNSVRLSSP